jgi:cytochrome c oxidase subunit II
MKLWKLLAPLVVVAGLAGGVAAQVPDDPPSPGGAADMMGGVPTDPAAPTAAGDAPTQPPADAPGVVDPAAPPAVIEPPDGQLREAGEPAEATGIPAWITELEKQPWDTGGNFWMPTPAAKEADPSDFMFYAVLGLSAFFFIAITIAVIVFTIKYRARPGHKATPSPSHNDALEITWTVIPTIIVVFLFIGGWEAYLAMNTRPAEPVTIKVTAKKWNWDFEYPNGLHLPDLHVPVDRPIELQMTSVDVLHAFFVPAFRVKSDIVPRRYTYVYFTPTRPGVYRLYCAEYCGMDHSLMKGKAFVHDGETWARFLSEYKRALETEDPIDLGRRVFDTKGCAACHSLDGTPKVGPTWQGIWGEQAQMTDGRTVTVDAQYIKDAIVEPLKELRPGYAPSMPSYAGQLSENEINGVIELIRSLQ